ncbi:MAG TPA: carbohydrate kinase [Planctomycetes bacterium]|nr:carbohydrate kinase [Planctomycetota bacterium]
MSLTFARLGDILRRMSDVRIAVVGDMVADVYLDAEPVRLSREAPVMVSRFRKETLLPGGAANAVNNLRALGVDVMPFGVVGADDAGMSLTETFASMEMEVKGIVIQDDYETIMKTRVMLSEEGRRAQQVLRIDREPCVPVSPQAELALLRAFRRARPDLSAVILSDYGYGAVTDGVIEAARSASPDILVAADSRYGLRRFRGVDVATPNIGEAGALVGRRLSAEQECREAGLALRRDLELECLLITRGNQGLMVIDQKDEPLFLPASGAEDEVTDVSGAGDTVIALMTAARAAGAEWEEAAELANLGAGVVVTKLGAATASPEEILNVAARES